MIEVYKKILQYVDEHIDKGININDLILKMGYSRRHIYKIFKDHNDVPIMEYIRRKKLSVAASELSSGRNIYDIALDYGYETSTGFYKAFQSVFGCSPSDYKNDILRGANMNNKSKTIEELNNSIKIDPTNGVLYFERANLYLWSLEQPEKAIEDLNKAIELDPKNTDAYSLRVHMYFQTEQPEKAIEDLNKAIELDPNNSYFYGQRAQIYSQQIHHKRSTNFSRQLIQPEKALEDYTKAIELDPNNAFYYRDRANVYRNLNQPEKAAKDVNKALEVSSNPTSAWDYNNRGLLYQQLKQFDKALEEYHKTTEVDPNNLYGYFNRGMIYMSDLNDYEKALEEFNNTVR